MPDARRCRASLERVPRIGAECGSGLPPTAELPAKLPAQSRTGEKTVPDLLSLSANGLLLSELVPSLLPSPAPVAVPSRRGFCVTLWPRGPGLPGRGDNSMSAACGPAAVVARRRTLGSAFKARADARCASAAACRRRCTNPAKDTKTRVVAASTTTAARPEKSVGELQPAPSGPAHEQDAKTFWQTDGEMEPWGQYEPRGQGRRSAGVGQNQPAGHTFHTPDPSGHQLPAEHSCFVSGRLQ